MVISIVYDPEFFFGFSLTTHQKKNLPNVIHSSVRFASKPPITRYIHKLFQLELRPYTIIICILSC